MSCTTYAPCGSGGVRGRGAQAPASFREQQSPCAHGWFCRQSRRFFQHTLKEIGVNAQDTSGPLTTQAVPPPHTSSLRLTPRSPGSQPTAVVVGSVRAALSVSKSGTPGPVVAGHHMTSPLTAPTGGPSHAARSVVTDAGPDHPTCEAVR